MTNEMTVPRPPFVLERTARQTYRVSTRAGRILGYVMCHEDRRWSGTVRRDGKTISAGRHESRVAAAFALVALDEEMNTTPAFVSCPTCGAENVTGEATCCAGVTS